MPERKGTNGIIYYNSYSVIAEYWSKSLLQYFPHETIPENQFNPGFTAGIDVNQVLLQHMEFAIGLRMFNVGRYDEVTFSSIKQTVNISHIYVSLPLKLGYRVFNNLLPFLSLEPALQVYSREQGTTTGSPDTDRTITDEMERFNLFTGVGLTWFFKISDRDLSITSAFNYGLLRVSKDEKFDVTDNSYRRWTDWRALELAVYLNYYFGRR